MLLFDGGPSSDVIVYEAGARDPFSSPTDPLVSSKSHKRPKTRV